MKGYVYKFTSPSNKVYIGITNDIRRRYAEHKRLSKQIINRKFYIALRKYGFENFSFEVLEKYDVKTKEELYDVLNEREMYYIEKYDSFNNGYNLTKGGDGTRGLEGELNPFYHKHHTEESKAKMSKAHKGKVLSEDHKRKIAESTRITLNNLPPEKKTRMSHPQLEKRKQVICLETQIIYNSLTECSDKLEIGISEISAVCKGKRITAKGLTFRFVEENKIKEVNRIDKSKRKIICINNGIEYESISEAARQLGVKHQHISAILNGRQKTTKGYTFKYK